MVGWMPCCCDCWTFNDGFNESDSTTLTSNWDETTGAANGNWGYTDQRLVETFGGGGTANSIVFCTQPVPSGSAGEMQISVGVKSPQTGDIVRIYPCCTAVGTLGSVTVTFEFVAGPECIVTISGGTDSETYDVVEVDGLVYLFVCADHFYSMIRAEVSNAIIPNPGPVWADNQDPGTGRYAALGHNNPTNGAKFDNFHMAELRHGSVDCLYCWCTCDGIPIKRTLLLTVYDATDRASCLDGETITLEWDYNAATPIWYGEDVWYDGVTVTATLVCVDGTNNWRLFMTPYGGCFLNEYTDSTEESTCDPLNLVYGPFTLSQLQACSLCYPIMTGPIDGQFYIAITEV